MKVLYTAQAIATGGRDGQGKTADGKLDLTLGTPKALGGTDSGVNPEQLFAIGYAACFLGAMKHVAARDKGQIPADSRIDSEVSLGANDNDTFGIDVTLNIFLPGMEKAAAEKLVHDAHLVCPYSNATRGNIDVKLNINV